MKELVFQGENNQAFIGDVCIVNNAMSIIRTFTTVFCIKYCLFKKNN